MVIPTQPGHVLSLRDILGLNARFGVTIDGLSLGMWGSCEGIGVDFGVVTQEQGGVYDYLAILPGQVKYTNVTLKRALNAQDSATVQGWLSKMVSDWVYAAGSGSGGTAVITLFAPDSKPVISWTLRNVFPAKWDGPKLDASSAGIAIETLTLCHEGFL